MNSKILLGSAFVLAAAAGCSGPRGKAGPAGPVGPVAQAPTITSVYPGLVSPATNVRIGGTGFVGSAGTMVLVDGHPATVLSVSPTEIRATGFYYSAGVPEEQVTVFADGRTSNSYPIQTGTRGDQQESPALYPGVFSAAVLGSNESFAYVADQYATRIGYQPESSWGEGAIYRYDFDKNRLTPVYEDTDVDYISSLAQAPDGSFYFGAEDPYTGNPNLYRIDSTFDLASKQIVVNDATCSDITALTWAPNGTLWMGDSDGCINALTSTGQFYYDTYSIGGYGVSGLFAINGGVTAVNYYDVIHLDDALPDQNYISDVEPEDAISASTTDGTNVYVLSAGVDGAVTRVTGSDYQAIVPGNAALNDSAISYAYTSSPHFMLHLSNGDTWFSAGNGDASISRIDKGGHFEQEWVTPYDNASYGLSVGDSMFYTFDFLCYAGIGAPVMKQTVDGSITAIAHDVCGDTNLASANGMLYVADPRGYILQIDPVEGSQSVVTADPALGIPRAFATDGSNFFVATSDSSGNYSIARVGVGTGGTVDPGFVTGIVNEPVAMVVSGSTLYWVDASSAHSIGTEGGAVTDPIPQGMGFNELYSVGLGPDGAPLYTDNNGTYYVDSSGAVRVFSDQTIWFPSPDSFGGVSGLDSNEYIYAQVLP